MAEEKQAGESLTLNYTHQLDIAKRLCTLANKVLGGTLTDERGFSRKDYVFFGLTDKSLHTFEAIQVLCARSLLDDAYALVRVLIEGIINGTYVSTMNDSIANDYADFSDYRDWIEFRDLEKVAPEITSTVPKADVEEIKKKYSVLRARYEKNSNGDWCPESLFKRAAAIDGVVGHGFNLMRTLVNLPWRKACAWVHGTSASILSRVEETESGVVIHRKYNAEEAAGVLYMSNMAIFGLLALADLRLGAKNKEEWKGLYNAWGGKECVPSPGRDCWACWSSTVLLRGLRPRASEAA